MRSRVRCDYYTMLQLRSAGRPKYSPGKATSNSGGASTGLPCSTTNGISTVAAITTENYTTNSITITANTKSTRSARPTNWPPSFRRLYNWSSGSARCIDSTYTHANTSSCWNARKPWPSPTYSTSSYATAITNFRDNILDACCGKRAIANYTIWTAILAPSLQRLWTTTCKTKRPT